MNANSWSRTRYIAAGLVLYLLFLVVTLPAAWVGELLTRFTHGQARLLGSQGSLWRGSGLLVFSPAGGMALQNRVHWNVAPLWLVTGQLRTEIRSEGDVTLQTMLTVGYRHLRLQQLTGEFTASQIQAFYPPAMLVSPTGQIKIAADDVSLGKSGFHGEMRMTWTGAGSKLGAAGELGDYLLVANGENGAANLRVETLRGDIRVDARGAWQAQGDGTLSLDGSLMPGSRESAIGAMLAALNARKEGDHYPLRINTRLPLPAFLGRPG